MNLLVGFGSIQIEIRDKLVSAVLFEVIVGNYTSYFP